MRGAGVYVASAYLNYLLVLQCFVRTLAVLSAADSKQTCGLS
jgi:hypothetical protein